MVSRSTLIQTENLVSSFPSRKEARDEHCLQFNGFTNTFDLPPGETLVETRRGITPFLVKKRIDGTKPRVNFIVFRNSSEGEINGKILLTQQVYSLHLCGIS